MNEKMTNTEEKKIEEIKKYIAEIINNNTGLKTYTISENGEEYVIEYIAVKSPFDLQKAIVDYITKTTPSHDEIKREAYILGYKAGWGDDAVYKTNGELEEEAKESFDNNKSLLDLTHRSLDKGDK